jgi:type II secretory pathway pseudopilin PulG
VKKYQDGFSAIEGLLIVVIVGMLGGVGWYVWHANSQANSNLDHAVNSSNNSADATKKAQENKKANIYAGWKSFCDPISNIGCIKYPADWSIEKYLDKTAQIQYVYISSPQNSKHNAPIVTIIDPQSSGDPDKGGLSWHLSASPNDLPYDNKDKAEAWFDSTESVTATEIVQSFTFQKK